MFKLRYWLVALALCTTAACSSSSDKDNGAAVGDVPSVGQSVTVSITANDGGDVKIGGAKLSIAGGALDGDTDITLEIQKPAADLPEADTVKGPVYAFGPDGTKFGTAADLSLPLPSKPGAGETPVLSWLDTTTNTWQDLETTVSGSSVTAAVPHFTFFVIRFKGVTGPVDCSFTACGGDLTGVWSIDAGCIDDSADNSLKGCPTATLDAQTDISGTVEFKSDKTYAVALTIGGSIAVKVPSSCLMGGTCADVGSSLKATCTSSSAGCDCTKPIDSKHSADSGTYVMSSNTFTTTKTGSTSPGDSNEYCVSGNSLKVKIVDSSGKITILVGTKP